MYEFAYTIRDIKQAERWFLAFKTADKAAVDHTLSLSRQVLKPLAKPKLPLVDRLEKFYFRDQAEILVWEVDRQGDQYNDLPVLFWTQEFVLTWKDFGDRDIWNVIVVSWEDFIKKAKK